MMRFARRLAVLCLTLGPCHVMAQDLTRLPFPTFAQDAPKRPSLTFNALGMNRLFVKNLNTYGTFETAVAASIIANSDGRPGVLGILNPSELATYGNRDSVDLYTENTLPPLIANPTGHFTALTFVPDTPLSADVVSKLRVGMTVRSNDYYDALIASWAPDGTSITVQDGWFHVISPISTALGQIPGGSSLAINTITKVLAHNANVFVRNNSYGTSFSGFELGLINDKEPYVNQDQVGFDVVSLGQYETGTGYYQRGLMQYGYRSMDAAIAGFTVDSGSRRNPQYGFFSRAADGKVIGAQDPRDGKIYFSALFNANTTEMSLNIGKQGGGTPLPQIALFSATNPAGDGIPDSAIQAFGSRQYGNSTVRAEAYQYQVTNIDDGSIGINVQARLGTANFINTYSGLAGQPPVISTGGTDANMGLAITGQGTSGALTGMFVRGADPTSSDIASGFCADWQNTSAGTVKHVCNVGGTLRSVTLN